MMKKQKPELSVKEQVAMTLLQAVAVFLVSFFGYMGWSLIMLKCQPELDKARFTKKLTSNSPTKPHRRSSA